MVESVSKLYTQSVFITNRVLNTNLRLESDLYRDLLDLLEIPGCGGYRTPIGFVSSTGMILIPLSIYCLYTRAGFQAFFFFHRT